MGSFLFYFISLAMIFTIYALFVPTIDIIVRFNGQWQRFLPVLFLLVIWIMVFLKARREMIKKNFILSYGWIMGATSLLILLLYIYLKKYAGIIEGI